VIVRVVGIGGMLLTYWSSSSPMEHMASPIRRNVN